MKYFLFDNSSRTNDPQIILSRSCPHSRTYKLPNILFYILTVCTALLILPLSNATSKPLYATVFSSTSSTSGVVAVAIKSLGTRRPSKLPVAAPRRGPLADAVGFRGTQWWHHRWHPVVPPAARRRRHDGGSAKQAFSFLLPHNIRW